MIVVKTYLSEQQHKSLEKWMEKQIEVWKTKMH